MPVWPRYHVAKMIVVKLHIYYLFSTHVLCIVCIRFVLIMLNTRSHISSSLPLLYRYEQIMATLHCLRAAKERRSCYFLFVSLWYRRMWHFSGCGHCGGIRCGMADGTRASAFTRRLVSGSNHRDLFYVNNYFRGRLVWYISISCNRHTFPNFLVMVAAITSRNVCQEYD